MNITINEAKKTLQIEEPISLQKLADIVEKYLPSKRSDWILIMKGKVIHQTTPYPVHIDPTPLEPTPYPNPLYPIWNGTGARSNVSGDMGDNLGFVIKI